MIGLTWLHIADRLQKGEKEFDRQVIRAALIRDIGRRSGAGPDLSMMNLLGPLPKACDGGPDRLFMTPDNHDMDLVVFEKLPSEIKKPPGSGEGAHRKM